ncbi:MAG: hypothetical protein AAF804_03105 [Bacteroidota bacterium]
MRPKLKISQLTNLQDARSSAAVGFDLISFSLERGSNRKLSVSMAWNMIQWLSGPAITLELNRASLPEWEEAKKSFEPEWITLPWQDWEPGLAEDVKVILRVEGDQAPPALKAIMSEDRAENLFLELHLSSIAEIAIWHDWLERAFLHFPDLDQAEAYIDQEYPLPYGFSFYQEAEEEPGVLDYVRIDDFMEVFNEKFEED